MKDDPSFAFNFYTAGASPTCFCIYISQEWRAFHFFLQCKSVYDSMVSSIEFKILLEHHFLGDLDV